MPYIPVATGDIILAETINDIATGSAFYSADTGTVDAFKVRFDGTSPNFNAMGTLTNGNLVLFQAANSNTGASTLEIIGPTGSVVKPVTRQGGASLASGDIVAGQLVLTIYNAQATRFELIGKSQPSPAGLQPLYPALAAFPSNGVLDLIASDVAAGTNPFGAACDPTGRYAYVTNYGGNTVSMYSLTTPYGALSSIGSAVASGSGPAGIACDPSGRFVYVCNATASTISMYSIGASGALTSIASAIASGANPFSVCCDPTGRYVYAANNSANSISMYSIGPNGALTSIATAVATGNGPSRLCCTPNGRYVYCTNNGGGTGNTISMYSIGSNGALTSIAAAVTVGSGPFGIACDPFSRYVYVSHVGANTIAMLSVGANGVLSSITTAIASGGLGPYGVVVDPTGRYVFVSNRDSNNVSMFAVFPNGSLVKIADPVACGNAPNQLAMDPTGRYVYIANNGANTVSQFEMGQLLPLFNSVNQVAKNTYTRKIQRSALAASSSATVAQGVGAVYGGFRIVDNQGNIVDYNLTNGTLVQVTTNSTYSVTASPAANKVGLSYASNAVSINLGSGWTNFSWACFMDITTS